MRSILLLTMCLSSCAYSYADKQSEAETATTPAPSTKVVTLKEDPNATEKAAKEKAEDAKPIANSTSPCGVPEFKIHFFDANSRIEKTIDCVTKLVVDTKRTDVEPANFDTQRSDNLPPKTWYLLVDPAGADRTQINNQNLLKLSQQFHIEFFGRHERKNLLVYTYLESVK